MMEDKELFEKLFKLNNKQLLKIYTRVIITLENRDVVRTQNSPIGDYTEWLVSKAYDYKLETNSKAGYDAIAKDGTKIQIKARRIMSSNDPKQLSAIRNLDKNDFDVLIAVIYDKNCDIIEALTIPHNIIKEYAGYSGHVNSSILTITDKIKNDSRIKNITKELVEKELIVNAQNGI
jgi:hypothetical protein